MIYFVKMTAIENFILYPIWFIEEIIEIKIDSTLLKNQ